KTADGVLENSGGYKLDVEKNQLSSVRRIRNVSSESVTLSLAQNYVDPRLLSDPEANHELTIKWIFLTQASSGGNAGPADFPPGQAGYSGSNLTTPNRILDAFLGKDMGMMASEPLLTCATSKGSCTPQPPCPTCILLSQLGGSCGC